MGYWVRHPVNNNINKFGSNIVHGVEIFRDSEGRSRKVIAKILF